MVNINAIEKTEKSEDKKRGRHILFLLLKITVSISLLAYLVTKLDLSSFTKLDSGIIWYIGLSSIVMLCALGFMALRWKLVLALIEMKKYSLPLLYRFYLIGSFFNIFIPGAIGGDAMRVYYVSKAYHLTKTKSLLSIFMERVAGLFAIGFILMFSILLNDTIRSRLDFGFTVIALSSAGIVLALIIVKYYIKKKMTVGYKEMATILLLSGAGQFGDILITYIYTLYFGLNISILNLMSIMPLVYIATVIPISLGGIGVREGVMTAGMALYGVDVSDAVMVSFLLYLVKIMIGIVGMAVYLTYRRRLRKDK